MDLFSTTILLNNFHLFSHTRRRPRPARLAITPTGDNAGQDLTPSGIRRGSRHKHSYQYETPTSLCILFTSTFIAFSTI